MPLLNHSAAALRIYGDDLIPDEITNALGVSPTDSHTKGEIIPIGKSGRTRIPKIGIWLLRASPREPADLSAQVHEILGQLTDSPAVWQDLTARYRVDLSCGLFLEQENEELEISAESLVALGSRGIGMALDIYGGRRSDEAQPSDDQGGST